MLRGVGVLPTVSCNCVSTKVPSAVAGHGFSATFNELQLTRYDFNFTLSIRLLFRFLHRFRFRGPLTLWPYWQYREEVQELLSNWKRLSIGSILTFQTPKRSKLLHRCLALEKDSAPIRRLVVRLHCWVDSLSNYFENWYSFVPAIDI